eukprot:1155586-Rhodomonas_salina.1
MQAFALLRPSRLSPLLPTDTVTAQQRLHLISRSVDSHSLSPIRPAPTHPAAQAPRHARALLSSDLRLRLSHVPPSSALNFATVHRRDLLAVTLPPLSSSVIVPRRVSFPSGAYNYQSV